MEFHRNYLDTINSGTKLYVVEQKTERFKFFIDLDYKAHDKLSDEDLNQFCTIIHEAIGSSSTPYFAARAQPRPIKDNLIKSGVHIHWPDIVVTRNQALNLRTKIIESLGEGQWDEIIDASVYGGSGLRMLWSHKKPSGDPYVPLGLPKTVETLELMSVRVKDGDIHDTRDVIEIDGLEDFIRKFKGQETTRIKRVQRHDHDGWFLQTDSTYCDRIKRPHRSNHVWFSIRSGRISQRCFDEECRDYKGPEHNLPPSIVRQLDDVAIVDSDSNCLFMDIFPHGAASPFQKIRGDDPAIFGAGPGQLESFFAKSPRV